jgi:hypothetical protein
MVPSGSKLVDASNVTVWPTVGLAGLKVNDAVGARSVIVFVADAMLVEPLSSVTVRVTVYVPAFAYEWLVVAPVAVIPSPKFHA